MRKTKFIGVGDYRTISYVAQELGITYHNVYYHIDKKHIKDVKWFGEMLLVNKNEIDKWKNK